MPGIPARAVSDRARLAARLLYRPPVRTDLQEPVVGRKFGFGEQAAFQAEIANSLAAVAKRALTRKLLSDWYDATITEAVEKTANKSGRFDRIAHASTASGGNPEGPE